MISRDKLPKCNQCMIFTQMKGRGTASTDEDVSSFSIKGIE